jgi:signal transduction histidine kinase
VELTVADTGVGLREDAPEGVGLANIRDRLGSLYSGAELALHANVPRGLVATVLIPTA